MSTADFGRGKTIFVLAIVIGCFAVLWPKIFYPMLTASISQTQADNAVTKPAKKGYSRGPQSVCCDVISVKDTNAYMVMSDICKSIAMKHDEMLKEQREQQPKQKKQVKVSMVTLCRNEILQNCGVDIIGLLQEDHSLTQEYKKSLVQLRNFNTSLCMKLNYRLDFRDMGLPRKIKGPDAIPSHMRPERPFRPGPDMIHPALRERGRAIPTMNIPRRTIEREARPGPVPGMRPPVGGAGHIPAAPKGGGTMGIIMPMYTIGIVCFFLYTIMKILFKKSPEAEQPVKPVVKDYGMDPEHRKYVFSEEYTEGSERSIKDTLNKEDRDMGLRRRPSGGKSTRFYEDRRRLESPTVIYPQYPSDLGTDTIATAETAPLTSSSTPCEQAELEKPTKESLETEIIKETQTKCEATPTSTEQVQPITQEPEVTAQPPSKSLETTKTESLPSTPLSHDDRLTDEFPKPLPPSKEEILLSQRPELSRDVSVCSSADTIMGEESQKQDEMKPSIPMEEKQTSAPPPQASASEADTAGPFSPLVPETPNPDEEQSHFFDRTIVIPDYEPRKGSLVEPPKVHELPLEKQEMKEEIKEDDETRISIVKQDSVPQSVLNLADQVAERILVQAKHESTASAPSSGESLPSSSKDDDDAHDDATAPAGYATSQPACVPSDLPPTPKTRLSLDTSLTETDPLTSALADTHATTTSTELTQSETDNTDSTEVITSANELSRKHSATPEIQVETPHADQTELDRIAEFIETLNTEPKESEKLAATDIPSISGGTSTDPIVTFADEIKEGSKEFPIKIEALTSSSKSKIEITPFDDSQQVRQGTSSLADICYVTQPLDEGQKGRERSKFLRSTVEIVSFDEGTEPPPDRQRKTSEPMNVPLESTKSTETLEQAMRRLKHVPEEEGATLSAHETGEKRRRKSSAASQESQDSHKESEIDKYVGKLSNMQDIRRQMIEREILRGSVSRSSQDSADAEGEQGRAEQSSNFHGPAFLDSGQIKSELDTDTGQGQTLLQGLDGDGEGNSLADKMKDIEKWAAAIEPDACIIDESEKMTDADLNAPSSVQHLISDYDDEKSGIASEAGTATMEMEFHYGKVSSEIVYLIDRLIDQALHDGIHKAVDILVELGLDGVPGDENNVLSLVLEMESNVHEQVENKSNIVAPNDSATFTSTNKLTYEVQLDQTNKEIVTGTTSPQTCINIAIAPPQTLTNIPTDNTHDKHIDLTDSLGESNIGIGVITEECESNTRSTTAAADTTTITEASNISEKESVENNSCLIPPIPSEVSSASPVAAADSGSPATPEKEEEEKVKVAPEELAEEEQGEIIIAELEIIQEEIEHLSSELDKMESAVTEQAKIKEESEKKKEVESPWVLADSQNANKVEELTAAGPVEEPKHEESVESTDKTEEIKIDEIKAPSSETAEETKPETAPEVVPIQEIADIKEGQAKKDEECKHEVQVEAVEEKKEPEEHKSMPGSNVEEQEVAVEKSDVSAQETKVVKNLEPPMKQGEVSKQQATAEKVEKNREVQKTEESEGDRGDKVESTKAVASHEAESPATAQVSDGKVEETKEETVAQPDASPEKVETPESEMPVESIEKSVCTEPKSESVDKPATAKIPLESPLTESKAELDQAQAPRVEGTSEVELPQEAEKPISSKELSVDQEGKAQLVVSPKSEKPTSEEKEPTKVESVPSEEVPVVAEEKIDISSKNEIVSKESVEEKDKVQPLKQEEPNLKESDQQTLASKLEDPGAEIPGKEESASGKETKQLQQPVTIQEIVTDPQDQVPSESEKLAMKEVIPPVTTDEAAPTTEPIPMQEPVPVTESSPVEESKLTSEPASPKTPEPVNIAFDTTESLSETGIPPSPAPIKVEEESSEGQIEPQEISAIPKEETITEENKPQVPIDSLSKVEPEPLPSDSKPDSIQETPQKLPKELEETQIETSAPESPVVSPCPISPSSKETSEIIPDPEIEATIQRQEPTTEPEVQTEPIETATCLELHFEPITEPPFPLPSSTTMSSLNDSQNTDTIISVMNSSLTVEDSSSNMNNLNSPCAGPTASMALTVELLDNNSPEIFPLSSSTTSPEEKPSKESIEGDTNVVIGDDTNVGVSLATTTSSASDHHDQASSETTTITSAEKLATKAMSANITTTASTTTSLPTPGQQCQSSSSNEKLADNEVPTSPAPPPTPAVPLTSEAPTFPAVSEKEAQPTPSKDTEKNEETGNRERDARDVEIDMLRKRLEETEAAMERIVTQMGSVTDQLSPSVLAQVLRARGEDLEKLIASAEASANRKEEFSAPPESKAQPTPKPVERERKSSEKEVKFKLPPEELGEDEEVEEEEEEEEVDIIRPPTPPKTLSKAKPKTPSPTPEYLGSHSRPLTPSSPINHHRDHHDELLISSMETAVAGSESDTTPLKSHSPSAAIIIIDSHNNTSSVITPTSRTTSPTTLLPPSYQKIIENNTPSSKSPESSATRTIIIVENNNGNNDANKQTIAQAKAAGSPSPSPGVSVVGIEETASLSTGERWDMTRTPTPTFRQPASPVPHRPPSPPEQIPSIYLEGPMSYKQGQELVVREAQIEVEATDDFDFDEDYEPSGPVILSGKVTLSVISSAAGCSPHHEEVTEAPSLSLDDRAQAEHSRGRSSTAGGSVRRNLPAQIANAMREEVKVKPSKKSSNASSPDMDEYEVIGKGGCLEDPEADVSLDDFITATDAEPDADRAQEDTAADISTMDDLKPEPLPKDEE